MRCGPVQTWRTVAAAVLVTLSEFFGSASSRKHSPRTAATPSCAERKLLHGNCGACGLVTGERFNKSAYHARRHL